MRTHYGEKYWDKLCGKPMPEESTPPIWKENYLLQQQYIEELERELNEWKRWCKEKEQALDDLVKVFSQQQDHIKRLEEAIQERDKEWFQVIESILGFHPVSMTEALRIGIERIKKQKQRIKRLEELGHELRECASQLGWTSSDDSRWIERAEAVVEAWDKAKEDKL